MGAIGLIPHWLGEPVNRVRRRRSGGKANRNGKGAVLAAIRRGEAVLPCYQGNNLGLQVSRSGFAVMSDQGWWRPGWALFSILFSSISTVSTPIEMGLYDRMLLGGYDGLFRE
jgi:hypothetical protein